MSTVESGDQGDTDRMYTIFDEYLEYFNVLSITSTCILIIFWLFLLGLMCYVLSHIFCKKNVLHRQLKIFATLSTFSFLCYLAIILAAMIFYQCGRIRKYVISVAISYIFQSLGKSSMYFLFLHTLYITFKRSKYQIRTRTFRFVTCLIIINGLIYLCQSYFWLQHRLKINHGQSPMINIWHLSLLTLPLELIYSLFIVGLFGRRLFVVNLSRINEQKTSKYAKIVRKATTEVVAQQKQKLQLFRSVSINSVVDGADVGDIHQNQMNGVQPAIAQQQETTHTRIASEDDTSGAPSPRSPSLGPMFGRTPSLGPMFGRHLGGMGSDDFNNSSHSQLYQFAASMHTLGVSQDGHNRSHSALALAMTPSMRQRKSINIHRFNKQNKELLDHYQLTMIQTAARYTLLSSVAFFSSLLITGITGSGQIYYHSAGDWLIADRLNFDMIILSLMAGSAIICDLCVLLNFSFCSKLYGVLCCCCKCCYTGCLTYCSLRRIMTDVEDKLAQEIQAEFKDICSDSTFELDMARVSSDLQVNDNGDLQANSTVEKDDEFVVVHGSFPSGFAEDEPDDVQKEQEQEQEADEREPEELQLEEPRISKKVTSITVTSPDNKDMVIVHEEKKLSKILKRVSDKTLTALSLQRMRSDTPSSSPSTDEDQEVADVQPIEDSQDMQDVVKTEDIAEIEDNVDVTNESGDSAGNVDVTSVNATISSVEEIESEIAKDELTANMDNMELSVSKRLSLSHSTAL